MAALDEYLDNTMEADDIFPCKGCGEILEEGKAFELAGHRWHLNCFRCNSCGTLLDSDANLLLLGDGSLICNNCTYSCSACGNKIEDLAILTGEQAFCATCFRCRNCKRKIENLRYARTSQGIFCMSCHESLMARRRKKHKAAAQAKAREKEGSPMITDKSLPALPPQTPTELSPRPRVPYPRNEPSSLSSSIRPDRSPERSSTEATSNSRDSLTGAKPSLTLPSSSYRNNRNSAMFGGGVDLGASDSESFFIPVALDPSPGPSVTPRSVSDSLSDPKKGKERADYFSETKTGDSQASTPHIAFQAGSTSTPDYDSSGTTSKDLLSRKPSKSSRTDRSVLSSGTSSAGEDHKHASSNGRSEEFKLQEAPKSKKATANSRANSQANNSLGNALEFDTPKASRRDKENTASPPVSTSNSSIGGRSSQDARHGQDDDEYPDSSGLTTPTSRPSQSSEQHVRTGPIARKELPTSARTINGKPISSPLGKPSPAEEIPQPTLAPPPVPRPGMQEHKLSDTYMQPRAPPQPPSAPAPPPGQGFQTPSKESVVSTTVTGNDPQSPPKGPSPKLPRWSAGGDFSMDEDMARILGTDESSSSILRRVSNAVRHGRNSSAESSNFNHGNGISPRGHNRSVSETTRATASPRWPKTPIVEDSGAHDISSPISLAGGGTTQEDPALLKRRLRNSEQRVAELERQFGAEKDLKSLNKKLLEKRRTVSVLDTQAEIMIRQLEVLAGYVERAKTTKQPIDAKELEDSAIKDFVQRLNELQSTMATTIEQLHAERDALVEEKNQAVADRDRALLEFEQLSSKNAQLADMNNDLTHQIQERFKSQIGPEQVKSPNGLGIYHSHKGPSISSMNLDSASIGTSTNATLIGTDGEEPIVESGPTVVNIRKGQVRKFNWKKGSKTVAQNLTKGVNRAVGAFQNDREQQRGGPYQGLTGDSIGLPYNMTVASVDSPTAFGAQTAQQIRPGEFGSTGSGVGGAGNGGGVGNRGISGPISGPMPGAVPGSAGAQGNANGGFGFFSKKSGVPKSGTATSLMNNAAPPVAESPSTLFGSDLVERADYERRQIPSVVTRCIEEVELRGMDIEGIYRKTGGNSQVKAIQEGFEKQEDYDISDPGLDITAVTSVLKQYFRKLPNPLLTFEVYDGVLESINITDNNERCAHLRKTFNMLPPKHRDCLEFLMFHLARVANRERENLMSPKNLAVVFAPTILHTQNLEREMTDMHSKNLSIQFVIENSHTIFSEA